MAAQHIAEHRDGHEHQREQTEEPVVREQRSEMAAFVIAILLHDRDTERERSVLPLQLVDALHGPVRAHCHAGTRRSGDGKPGARSFGRQCVAARWYAVTERSPINRSATTAASNPGTTKPGRPVASATNVTAASGTRYPAPRNAATPTTVYSDVSSIPKAPPSARPVSAPATTSGTNKPPTPPPATAAEVATNRSRSATTTIHA